MAVSPSPAPPDPRRLLVLGDTHAYGWGMKAAIARAAELGCDAILSVGDLGYWPRDGGGQNYLAKLRRGLSRAGIELYFVEGNHEDYVSLRDPGHPQVGPFRLVVKPYRRAKRGGVYHVPRGARWSWGGIRFLGVGGAYSINRDEGVEGRDWFPEELISVTERDAIVSAGGEVDVLIAHDCPAGLNLLGQVASIPISALNSERLAAICASATPILVLHGHYHAFHDTIQHDEGRGIHARVVGLDCVYADEVDNRSTMLLDLAEFAAAAPGLRTELYGG